VARLSRGGQVWRLALQRAAYQLLRLKADILTSNVRKPVNPIPLRIAWICDLVMPTANSNYIFSEALAQISENSIGVPIHFFGDI
jgi:hypothetical protein